MERFDTVRWTIKPFLPEFNSLVHNISAGLSTTTGSFIKLWWNSNLLRLSKLNSAKNDQRWLSSLITALRRDTSQNVLHEPYGLERYNQAYSI